MPPAENLTWIKIDENNAYLASTSSTSINADDINANIQRYQNAIAALTTQLQSMAAVGVSNAQTVLDSLQK